MSGFLDFGAFERNRATLVFETHLFVQRLFFGATSFASLFFIQFLRIINAVFISQQQKDHESASDLVSLNLTHFRPIPMPISAPYSSY